jgi:hypothetical protein
MKTKTLQARIARLMPAGVPRYVRCYDNGESGDRYTVLFTGRASGQRIDQGHRIFQALGMSAAPFHPQGIGQHCAARDGAHLGRRIAFAELPEDCRRLVLRDYREIWRLNPEGEE